MTRLAVIGAGSWGTALSLHLAGLGQDVSLWVYEADLAREMAAGRENSLYLPGFSLPPGVRVTGRLEEALDGARLVVTAMPSHVCRRVVRQMLPFLAEGQVLVSATKGLEEGTHRRMSQILAEEAGVHVGPAGITVLSGPSFAREVAAGHPTAVVVASTFLEAAGRVQGEISGGHLRLYTETDVVGVELGGAVKNVIAIAAGVVSGLGLGHNTVAALITRGLVEMERLALPLGARRGTLAGLSGMGDLILTCTGELSRNRRLGQRLGQGATLAQALAETVMVAEGVRTTRSVLELGEEQGIEMPITREMDGILHRGADPREAIARLMERPLRAEKG